MLLLCCIVYAPTAYAQQQITVKGNVTDEAGEPIVGASIKSGSTGTVSDLDGNFTLSVPSNEALQVTYLGYLAQSVKVEGKSTLFIVLKEDTQSLDEVVIVGYSTQKLKNVTGAITPVNIKEVMDLPVTNLGASLKGLVPGLSISGGENRPGVGASMVIRNSDAISLSKDGAGQTPIFIVDDFVVSAETFNNLDPNEIESMSVLKDGAAAVYGVNSAAGAILIKTKRGKEGAPRVSYSGQIGFLDEISRPKMLSAYEYGEFYNRYMGSSGKGASSNVDPVKGYFQADELAVMKKLNYDWLEDAWKTSYSTKHNINISGGSKNATYFGSVSYLQQNGNLGTADYNRWNYRAGVDVKVAKHVKVALSVSGDYGHRETTLNKISGENDDHDYYTLLTTPKYMPAYVNGMPIVRYGPKNANQNNLNNYNYFELDKLGDLKENDSQNTYINTSIEYDFDWSQTLKGLKLKFAYSKTISTNKANQHGSRYNGYIFNSRSGSGNHLYETDWAKYSDVLTPDQIENYAGNFEDFKTTSVKNSDRLMRDMDRTDSYQMNFTASYGRTFGLHTINGLFSIERRENENEFVRFYKDSPLSFDNGQSNSATGSGDGQTTRSEAGYLSYIGRLNYSYADKYLFEFLIRSDASTKFAPENYWGTFPSFSAGWVISEEDFFKNSVKWMDFLKVRASVSFLGRDNVKAWQWLQRYTYQGNKGGVFGTSENQAIGWGLKMEAAPNRNVKWDNSTKLNFGLDTRYLDSRLSFNIDGYLDKGKNLLIQRDVLVPITIGGTLAAENYDAIDQYGIEISAGWRDKIGKDINYFVKVSGSWHDARYRKKDWPQIFGLTDVRPDGPVDVGAWGYDCIGMFRSQQEIDDYVNKYNIKKVFDKDVSELRPGMLYYKDVRGNQRQDGTYEDPDGIIDEKDMIQLSKRKSNPFGMTINFGGDWKGLSLSAQIGASWGGFAEVSDGRYIDEKTLEFTNVPVFWKDMFSLEDQLGPNGEILTAANPNAKYPNMYWKDFNHKPSNFWQVSSFRMSLRSVVLGYTLPKSAVSKIGIDNCRFTVTGTNLLSFKNPYPNNYYDPMSSYSSYPALRNISMGVNLTF
ncbi:MAG: TonB-dependent receptor [Dysgonomonas sp.]|nr:TonB-dependent receptor [Dysgonomonas sp.]